MGRMQDLLSLRLRSDKKKTSKTAALAQQSARGERNGFAGMFTVRPLTETERRAIESILDRYSTGDQNLQEDLDSLLSITGEVQAINNQAAILHGERIKQAQTILKEYAEGAFSAWLVETYGNRQTPYNLLQYYEFYSAVPQQLRGKLESMPRQAVYTLASREGDFSQKCTIVESYNGETKAELINTIREQFPLDERDGRRSDTGQTTLSTLKRLAQLLTVHRPSLTPKQREAALQLLDQLREQVVKSKQRA